MTSIEEDSLKYWSERWEANQIGFHKTEVHPMLIKHLDKLNSQDGKKPKNIFVPLCGKSLDMKWLADQGIQTVGVEGIQSAIEQFYTEQGLEWEEKTVPALDATGKLFSSKDGVLKLYCADMLKFSKDIAGVFDAVWDRGSLVALNRKDLGRYSKIIKDLLKPGGHILIELLQFDVKIMNDLSGPTKPPPPFPTYEEDLKKLFEPECSIQFVDKSGRKLAGKDIVAAIYLITKL
ncbi:thiopurine s-methyltransferase [Plakobranchus ocellatus]|uniref:thiopurine S-methyltransferase n=1 Tax=Plakobranchus ocellatus TaxID=259542 RepID=A0AAV3ZRR0_9GAST|nr:thiopurine s-methyltransferase [Plakobranchus ocellatus]